MNTLFCKRLKQLRTEYQKTQQDVAKTINKKRGTYSAYESGKIMPPAEKCKAMADYFHVSLDYLLGYAKTRGNPAVKSDVTDVSEIIGNVLHQLESDSESVAFDGDALSGEIKEILTTSLGNTLRLAKIMKKGMKK